MNKPYPSQLPDQGMADALTAQVLGNLLSLTVGAFISDQATSKEREHQEKLRKLELEQARLTSQIEIERLKFEIEKLKGNQQRSPNPFRNCHTVQDLESVLMTQPPSPQRTQALKELARYPESLPLSHLPSQSVRLLTGN